MSIVLQLQEEALQTDADLTGLLQKAFVVASKLGLRKFKKWVRYELDGCTNFRIPDYRHILGKTCVHNPYHGTVPLIIEDADMAAMASTIPLGDSISEIKHLMETGGDMFQGYYPPRIRDILMNGMWPMGVEPFLLCSKSRLKGILDRVKTELIDWSLRLERNGILGEGIRFTQAEVDKATKNENIITPQFVVNFIGGMTGSQLQQFSPFSRQDQ